MTNSKILIVDDDAVARNVLKKILSSAAHNDGFSIDVAASGTEALQKIEEWVPDLVLLDVMMPDMDGFEVCGVVRANPKLAEIPILLITALEDHESRLRGIEAGADDFISKPPNVAELLARVRTITRLNRYRRLHAERARFEWVVSQAQDGYLLVNEADEVIYSNRTARLYLGLEVDGDENQPLGAFLQLVQKQYHCEPEEAWKSWDLRENVLRYLVRPESDTAQAFWLQVARFEHVVGADTCRLIRLRDVTQRMNAQRDMRTFKSAILHKLRTPLTGIIASIQLLEEDSHSMSVEMADLIQVLVRSSENLQNEIEDVLKFVQAPKVVRAGKSTQGFQLGRLADVAEQMGSQLNIQSLRVECPDALTSTQILLSEQAVEWVLWEILENAQKFHPTQTPRVEIFVSKAGEREVLVSIHDDGIHLSPEQLLQAWTPFYQGEKDFTGNVTGMGLGLSVVASLVWEVGGGCRLANREHAPGIIVSLSLPVLKPEEEEQ